VTVAGRGGRRGPAGPGFASLARRPSRRPPTPGTVFDIRRYAIHDGPGIRTTVFLKGCALACWWCHNPESQAPGPELILHHGRCIRCGACVAACERGAASLGAEGPAADRERCAGCDALACASACVADAREVVGRVMTVEQVLEAVVRDEPFYEASGGGVTLSGGEPLFQGEFTAALLAGLKARGLHTALDTCGHAPWALLDRLRGDVDLFLYDVKLVDDERHRRYTGVSNRRILENLRALAGAGHRIVLRFPVIPGVTDDEDNLRAVAGLAAGLPGLAGVELLGYHRIGVHKYARLGRPYRLPDVDVPTRARLDAVASLFAAAGATVSGGDGRW
jgi:pyruvate formate lyase activating enzyme